MNKYNDLPPSQTERQPGSARRLLGRVARWSKGHRGGVPRSDPQSKTPDHVSLAITEKTPEEIAEDQARLEKTSPVVREPERLLSKNPIEVEDTPDNVVMSWVGGKIFDHDDHELRALESQTGRESLLAFTVPEGQRLIVDNIPMGDRADRYPYTEEHPLNSAQIQIYRNPHGYLVADRIVSDPFGDPEIFKMHDVSFGVSESGGLVLDQDTPVSRAMDNLHPYPDRKQYTNPSDPSDETVQLMTLTAGYRSEGSLFTKFDMYITSPHDQGSTVNVSIQTPPQAYRHEEYGPIVFRLIADTTDQVAHDIYQ